MNQPSKSEADLIRTVNAHLKQLAQVALHNADEPTMRVATGSLRFLLAEGNLARAWRASEIGGPIVFKAWCINSTGPGEIVAFCGGGDVLPGFSFSACRGAKLKEKQLDLSAFCRETRVQVGQVKISTVEVIQYVANALGGAHYDPGGKAAKKPKGDILRRIEAGEIQGVPLRVNDRSHLHHEILSIIQAVVRSPQIAKLQAWPGRRG
jgi:hypothetical protein